MARDSWTRQEQLLAFNLYCKIPFGQYHSRNPQVIELAQLINRTPGAVAMKLSNFASLDPYHRARGVRGLGNVSKADKAIWDEFHGDWNRLATESEEILSSAIQDRYPDSLSHELAPVETEYTRVTEAEQLTKVRLGQSFFRATILASYRDSCCICNMPIRALLVASHIIPWRERDDIRLNPHNGLCLCALHDRAFDKGLIAVSPDYHVLISPVIVRHFPNEAVSNGFKIYNERKIALPDKFLPSKAFLDHHCQNYFLQD